MNRQKTFLLFTIVASLFLVSLMMAKFTGYILTGLLLAFLLQPAHRGLSRKVPETVSAGSLILMTFIAAFMPFAVIAGGVADDATNIVESVQNIDEINIDGIEAEIEDIVHQDIDLRSNIRSAVQTVGSTVAGTASQALSLASSIVVGLSIMVFIQFYGLKDGQRFVNWTKKFDVLPDEIQEELYRKTATTTRAVMKGHVFVAIAQGLIAGIGLWIVGIPNILFWTVVMIILGFIPLIGTMFVWLPAAGYLLLNGQTNMGILLIAWGFLVVGAVDNFLRPYLVDESAGLHPLLVILGVIGGIGVFGIIGLFLGPVIFGIAKNLLEVYIEDYPNL